MRSKFVLRVLEHELANEVLSLVFSVLLATGKRFFSDGTLLRELALIGMKAASSGVIISTYRPNGPLRTVSFDDAADSHAGRAAKFNKSQGGRFVCMEGTSRFFAFS